MRMRASEIAEAVGGALSGPDVEVDGASFDSRSVLRGQLFVPIVGDRDGHEFIDAARCAGAAAYLTARPAGRGTAVEVADTADALLRLAAWARQRLPDRVVGVTGSVGKTSVKDLVAPVLARRWRTVVNERSYNNEQGLPVTILNAPDGAEAVVLEMGMRGFGEITRLAAVGRPSVGVVTAVAAAHTERVGGIDGVARAKGELVEALPAHGVAVLNADQPLVVSLAARTDAEVLTFGSDKGEVRVEHLILDVEARARFVLATPWGAAAVALGVPGRHMAMNAAAAAAVALALGVPLEEVVAGLGEARLSPWRMDLRRTARGAVVINDAYNANPASMHAALETLAHVPASRRVAVLGMMAELDGPEAAHRSVAEHADRLGIELVPVGTDLYGPTPADDPVGALGALGSDAAVLVKGSRVAALEKVAERLLAG